MKKVFLYGWISTVVIFLLVVTMAGASGAGEVKWSQRPDLIRGVNVISMLPSADVPSVADDWLCLAGSPVTDLHFWGSYPGWMEGVPRPDERPPGIEGFRIRIFSDRPASTPGDFSRPDRLLYEVRVTDFSETYIKSILLPWEVYEHKYRYDLDLPRIFWQRPGRIYWLNIAAIPATSEFPWGWESSMDRWNDFAVEGWYESPGLWDWRVIVPEELQRPIDMAFELTTCGGPLKWLQLPDMAHGRNIVSRADNPVVADDFLCTNGKPVTEVFFWGSFLDCEGERHWQQQNPGPPASPLPHPPPIQRFTLSFHTDVPAGTDEQMPWSHPGDLIKEIEIGPDDFSAAYWDSIPHTDVTGEIWWEHKFYYRVKLPEPFDQEQERIYWLNVGAELASQADWCWGWETSKDHWNDSAVRGEENRWISLGGDWSLEFEDLPLNTKYPDPSVIPPNPPSFVTSGVAVRVTPFQWSGGGWTADGFVQVTAGGRAAGSGQEMTVSNANMAFDLPCMPEELSLLFGEYGGNCNILINGDFRNVENLDKLDGLIVGGVQVRVTGGGGSGAGTLHLQGPIQKFAIGGQEFFVDDVKFQCRTDMAFGLITEDDTPYCRGDFDRDGDVDGADLSVIADEYGRTDCHAGGGCRSDINYDGKVDDHDLTAFAADYGRDDCPCSLPAIGPLR